MELTSLTSTMQGPVRQFCSQDGFCHASVKCATTCAKQKVVANLIEDATEQIGNSKNTTDKYYGYDDDKDIVEGTIDTNITGSSPMEKKQCRRNGKWSACMPDCRQTRRKYAEIQGKCTMIHIAKNDRDRRVCHIDACGSKDPCRVPFVVASFLSFPGDFSERWDWQAKEKLILSFSKSLNIVVKKDFPRMTEDVIGVGDVKIVEVMNMTKGTSDESPGVDNLPGFSIIVEVSISNPNIELPNDYAAEATIGTMEDTTQFAKFLAKTKKLWKNRKHVNCTESDIYSVSKTAMKVHVALEAETFPNTLLRILANEYKSKRTTSPFQTSLANYDNNKITFFVDNAWTKASEIPKRVHVSIKKEDVNSPMTFLLLFGALLVCYCGVCFGTCSTRRKFTSAGITNKVLEKFKKHKEEKNKGEYAEVGMLPFEDDFDFRPTVTDKTDVIDEHTENVEENVLDYVDGNFDISETDEGLEMSDVAEKRSRLEML